MPTVIVRHLIILGIITLVHAFDDCPIDWNMYRNVSKEKALIKCLLDRYQNYTTVGRPVTNTTDLISVEFGLSLIQIMGVDEKNQVLETNVWYTYQWKDALLQWDPDDYEGLRKIMVPPESVWIPDIVLYNFADERLKDQRSALVNVEFSGNILWMPQAILRSSCGFETKYFPFDTQKCYLQFGSWTHDGTYLDLQFFENISRFMVDDLIPSKEWDIIENRGARNVKQYECCENVPFIDLTLHLTLRRRVAFYTFILILPCALLSCLTLVIFWVPPEAPAKLSLGMNIFVAFFVLLLLLSESTPKAAESIPLIGAYFCLSMVMITMSTVLSTVIANMFFRGVRINRAPYWLRAVMINCIARGLCRGQLMEPEQPIEKKNNWVPKVKGGNQNSFSDSEMKFAKVRLLDNGRDERSHTIGVGMSNCSEFDQNNILGSTTLSDDIRAIRDVLERFQEKKIKQEEKEKCFREWKVICCVTDRLFFISYLLINIVGIIVIFYGQVV